MYEFWGRHTICNMTGVNEKVDLRNTRFLMYILRSSIWKSGATLVEFVIHEFSPEGISIIAILKESHVALHIYPGHRAAFLDAFTCGKLSDPEQIVLDIVNHFNPDAYYYKTIVRGAPDIRERLS